MTYLQTYPHYPQVSLIHRTSAPLLSIKQQALKCKSGTVPRLAFKGLQDLHQMEPMEFAILSLP